jgi:membrane-associated PAP2 superfamily phosphatase
MHPTAVLTPAQPLRCLSLAWLGALALTLLWDAFMLDMPLMRSIGSPLGFALRHDPLFERVLHDGLRQAAGAVFGLMLLWAVWPARWHHGGLPRRERWLALGLVLLCLLAVNLVKINSSTSCPWELNDFGGRAVYVSHWAFGLNDGGSGRCFPGGHASSAFAFIGLCLPWLEAPAGAGRSRRLGWRVLGAVLLLGVIAGGAQSLRGAHHPSHTLWTLLICAGVSLAAWRLAQPWLARARRLPVQTPSQTL